MKPTSTIGRQLMHTTCRGIWTVTVMMDCYYKTTTVLKVTLNMRNLRREFKGTPQNFIEVVPTSHLFCGYICYQVGFSWLPIKPFKILSWRFSATIIQNGTQTSFILTYTGLQHHLHAHMLLVCILIYSSYPIPYCDDWFWLSIWLGLESTKELVSVLVCEDILSKS